ncbi:MAG: RHS repeat-associated core domain-containing protein [Bacteroidales bacterium]|nr:RHS repeat-associated core domain-containing protein [Candidatus Cryptobacteroides caccocaballi]
MSIRQCFTGSVQVNSLPEATVSYSYDGIGRLSEVTYGNGVSERRTYTVQGWLKEISALDSSRATLFREPMKYWDTPEIAGGHSHPLYSGMISGVDSHNGNGTSPSGTLDYDYGYDYLWRLTEASLPGTDDWAEKGITYDRNGNLRSLTRHGGSGSVTDALSMSYYGYLNAGSLNVLHNGASVVFESSAFEEGVIYSHGLLYFTRDHLGNTRVVTDGSGNVVERNDYYPFGERHPDGSMPTVNSNRWRFAGKEIQPLGGTGWLDFGARQYDSFLGRWTTVDPLAEKYPGISPYSYCAGNPINFVDHDGKDPFSGAVIGATASYLGQVSGNLIMR